MQIAIMSMNIALTSLFLTYFKWTLLKGVIKIVEDYFNTIKIFTVKKDKLVAHIDLHFSTRKE
jgi:hypothetical protein